jgi:hypothetical protein
MRSGHGRGYYGEGQLAQDPPQRRGSGWVKLALVVGVGAVIWVMWPRTPKIALAPGAGDEGPGVPPLPLPPRAEAHTSMVPLPQRAQVAEGYPGQHAYEDAVVASARQLQASGARVELAPHLAHLAPRLGGAEDLVAQVTSAGLTR